MDPANSHPLPDVGSFSYSWPTSKPEPRPEERVHHGDITSFIGTDPASASEWSFDFRRSLPQQTEAMADADQMFLDGLLLPLRLATRQGQDDGDSGRREPVLTRSLSLDSSQRMAVRHRLPRPASQNSPPCHLRGGRAVTPTRGAVFRASKLRLPSFGLGRCGKQHKWMSFRFFAPWCQKITRYIWRRKAVDASERAKHGSAKVKLCDLGQQSAIRDAILHCKRSL